MPGFYFPNLLAFRPKKVGFLKQLQSGAHEPKRRPRPPGPPAPRAAARWLVSGRGSEGKTCFAPGLRPAGHPAIYFRPNGPAHCCLAAKSQAVFKFGLAGNSWALRKKKSGARGLIFRAPAPNWLLVGRLFWLGSGLPHISPPLILWIVCCCAGPWGRAGTAVVSRRSPAP